MPDSFKTLINPNKGIQSIKNIENINVHKNTKFKILKRNLNKVEQAPQLKLKLYKKIEKL